MYILSLEKSPYLRFLFFFFPISPKTRGSYSIQKRRFPRSSEISREKAIPKFELAVHFSSVDSRGAAEKKRMSGSGGKRAGFSNGWRWQKMTTAIAALIDSNEVDLVRHPLVV